jgi:glycosyltransferase involved in cell wall biosynthesis
MTTITNGFTTMESSDVRRHFSTQHCVFSYVGTLNDRRRPDIILEGLRSACRDEALARDVRVQFIGGMAGHEASIAEYGLQNHVVDLGKVSRQQSVEYMRGSDVNVLLQTITTGQDVVSGKAYEYLAAGRPIVAIVSPDGGDAWLMRDTGAGTVVPFDDAEAVAQVIRAHWERWRAGKLAPSVEPQALERFHPRRLAAQLAAIFDEILLGEQAPTSRQ